jgi:hypothetical protein
MFGLSTNTDPVMVFDSFGNLLYSHIAFNENTKSTTPPSGSGVLYVSTYRDGGAVYAKTVKVPSGSGLNKAPFEIGPGSSNFDDKNWMAADNSSSSPFYGRIYITWTKFGGQGGQSSVWLSHCGGNGVGKEECDGSAFTRGQVINRPVAGGLVQESFPAAAPNGDLYVAFLQFQGGFGSTRQDSTVRFYPLAKDLLRNLLLNQPALFSTSLAKGSGAEAPPWPCTRLREWRMGADRCEKGRTEAHPLVDTRASERARALQCVRTNPLRELLLISRSQTAEPIVVTG